MSSFDQDTVQLTVKVSEQFLWYVDKISYTSFLSLVWFKGKTKKVSMRVGYLIDLYWIVPWFYSFPCVYSSHGFPEAPHR
jgi:hypothetical protein